MIFLLALPLLAGVCLVGSIVASIRARSRNPFRWPSDAARRESHRVAVTLALWAIILLLAWIGLR